MANAGRPIIYSMNFVNRYPSAFLTLKSLTVITVFPFERNLKKKWEERSQLIAQLEEKVFKMKENFDSKEQKLMEERDTALKATK